MIGGMLAATFLAIFFVPVFFVLIQSLAGSRASRRRREAAAGSGMTRTAPRVDDGEADRIRLVTTPSARQPA